MNPSKKLAAHLSDTKNWRYRQKVRNTFHELLTDVRWIESKMDAMNFDEVDYLAHRVHASARLLDRQLTKKAKELNA